MVRSAGRRDPGFERLEGRALLSVSTPPIVSIADASIAEGNAGTRTFSFVVSLSAAAQQPATVRFQTVDGTATTAGGDYTARPERFRSAPGNGRRWCRWGSAATSPWRTTKPSRSSSRLPWLPSSAARRRPL